MVEVDTVDERGITCDVLGGLLYTTANPAPILDTKKITRKYFNLIMTSTAQGSTT